MVIAACAPFYFDGFLSCLAHPRPSYRHRSNIRFIPEQSLCSGLHDVGYDPHVQRIDCTCPETLSQKTAPETSGVCQWSTHAPGSLAMAVVIDERNMCHWHLSSK